MTLGIENGAFTLDGRRAFLLGISYYGALGALGDCVERDLQDFARLGFNWIRVWATWGAFEPVSAVTLEGEPRADDFLTDLRGALAGGAAGWCLHNGHQSDRPDGRPRRSFDMSRSEGRLLEQLDGEERQVLERAGVVVAAGGSGR